MSNIFINIWLACIRVLFTFLHIVYSGFQYFDLTWTLFKRKWFVYYSLNGVDSELYVSRFVTGLRTCPSHIAVIVGDDAISNQDFTNLVIWCLAAGISFLTVYDIKGTLKEREPKLQKYFFQNTSKQNQVVFQNLPIANGKVKNGFRNKIVVSTLSATDGKPAFTDVVRDIAVGARDSNTGLSSITQDMISSKLLEKSQWPDPEMAIVASSEMCTYGFPPWNIRLTEFMKVQSLENWCVQEFCNVLHRYSSIEKRLGK